MQTEKIILIKGGAIQDIKKALEQWIALYLEDLPVDFQFQLYRNHLGNYTIIAETPINNDLFFYLVNYIAYPEGIDYKVTVEGYTKGEKGELAGKELLVYISETDTEYDNVFVVTSENKCFKIDFGGKIKEVQGNKLYSRPEIDRESKPEKIKRSAQTSSKKEKNNSSVSKMFNILVGVVFAALLVNLTIPALINDVEVFEKTTWVVFGGVGLWFFMDEKMLQLDSYYIRSLLIAIAMVSYGYFLINAYEVNDPKLTMATSLYPLTLLLVQWPTRRLFKLLFNREPKVDNHGKFPDLLYTMILFFAFAALPLIIMDYVWEM